MSPSPGHRASWQHWAASSLLVVLFGGCALYHDPTLSDAVRTPRLLWLSASTCALMLLALLAPKMGWANSMAITARSPIGLVWLGWIAVSISTMGSAYNPGEAWYELAHMLVFFFAFIGLSGLLGDAKLRALALLILNVLVPVITAICIYQYVWLKLTPYSYQLSLRVEAWFANQNIGLQCTEPWHYTYKTRLLSFCVFDNSPALKTGNLIYRYENTQPPLTTFSL